MPRRPRLEDLLTALRAAAKDRGSPSCLETIRLALTSRIGHAAGKAAAMAGQFELAELTPDLVAAFRHFLDHPKDDPGCSGKAGIAEALYRLGHEDPEPFLSGVRCVQMEPVFGGKVDTAVDVRGASALGLVRCGYRDAMLELAELLADREPPARISALRAIAYRGGDDAAALLRYKALAGDDEPRVVAECFLALLQLDPRRSLTFVVRYLDGRDPRLAEAAAVALGESRLREAFEPLRSWSRKLAGLPEEGTALVALVTLRSDEATEYVVSLIRDATEATASRAIEALATHRNSQSLRESVEQAVAGRRERSLRKSFERTFGASPG